jgi:hypothetical protein
MSTRPPDLPDEPHDLLGDALWDRLGDVHTPPVPAGFDARLRAALPSAPPWYRRHWVSIGAGTAGFAAAAAALIVVLQPVDPPVSSPSADDLALVAELELMENLELLTDLELLMAWDGTTP